MKLIHSVGRNPPHLARCHDSASRSGSNKTAIRKSICRLSRGHKKIPPGSEKSAAEAAGPDGTGHCGHSLDRRRAVSFAGQFLLEFAVSGSRALRPGSSKRRSRSAFCRTRCNPSLPPRPAAARNLLPLPLRSGAEDSAGSARRPNAASPCHIRPQSPSASGRPADGSGSRRSKQPS